MNLKKILSALVASAMVPGTMVMPAFADGDFVAKVGDTEYATIEDAISAWTNNTTLTLLSDVQLNDAITLSSLEYHILDLSTYTMTAASDKDAIVISADGLTNPTYVLDISADETNPGGIIATGKGTACVKHVSTTKDRAIIRIYGGQFTAPYCLYHDTANGTNAPQFWIYGGEFTAAGQSASFLKPISAIYANRALIQIYDGKFNSGIHASVDTSAYLRIEGGTFASLKNSYNSALDANKVTIGTSKGTFDVNVYMDDDGNYVITKEDVSSSYAAAVPNSPSTNDYFAYSKVKTEGKMNYTDINVAIENAKDGDTVTLLKNVELSEDGAAAAAAAGIVFEIGEYELIFPEEYQLTEDGKIETLPPVAKVNDVEYSSLQEAINALEENGGTLTLLADIDASDYTTPVKLTKSAVIDGNNKTITGLSVPLFKEVNGGGTESVTIKDITVSNPNINGGGENASSAALIGWYENHMSGDVLVIDNVKVIGGSISADAYAAGLIGYISTVGTVEIKNSSVTGVTLTTNTSSVGALVGHKLGTLTLEDCSIGENIITCHDENNTRADKVGAALGRDNGGVSSINVTETAESSLFPEGTAKGRIVGSIVGGAVEITGGSYFADPTKVEKSTMPTVAEGFVIEADENGKFEVVEEEKEETLGSKTAYSRWTDENGKYIFWMFAGIDSLNYTEVGFEIKTGDGIEVTAKTNTVYSSITDSNGTTYNADDFSKNDYESYRIFAQGISFPSEEYAKSNSLEYTPYAITLEGTTIYGSKVYLDSIFKTVE